MKVMLEFLDRTGTAIHERELEYDGVPPIPSVGDLVLITPPLGSSEVVRVIGREFMYFADARVEGAPPPDLDVKVTCWIEPRGERPSAAG
jgi:hypothetical protein